LFPAANSRASPPARDKKRFKLISDYSRILMGGTERNGFPSFARSRLEPVQIVLKELFEIMKELPVKNRIFRVTLAVGPRQGRIQGSQNGPEDRKEPQGFHTPG
jgi:hypothetical protein